MSMSSKLLNSFWRSPKIFNISPQIWPFSKWLRRWITLNFSYKLLRFMSFYSSFTIIQIKEIDPYTSHHSLSFIKSSSPVAFVIYCRWENWPAMYNERWTVNLVPARETRIVWEKLYFNFNFYRKVTSEVPWLHLKAFWSHLKTLSKSSFSDLSLDEFRHDRHLDFSLIFLDPSCVKHSLLSIVMLF